MQKGIRGHVRPLLTLVSFVLPVLTLFILGTFLSQNLWSNTQRFLRPERFEKVWKGHLLLVIFLWLIVLETALNWNKLLERYFKRPKCFTIVLIVIVSIAPTVYVLSTFFFGLDQLIWDLGELVGLGEGFPTYETSLIVHWPLSLEYLLFATFFTVFLLLLYGTEGLRCFSISAFFIWAVGAFYTIDTFHPFGQATILQSIVPWIVTVVTLILEPMGYHVQYNFTNCLLTVNKPGSDPFRALIYWPCAGVYSLFIYTFVILLFLKGTAISLKGKVIYFIVGAVGTFFVNCLRVAAICKLAVDQGPEAGKLFHTYYGELFFIAWIIIYPLIIIGSHKLWMKLSKSKFVQDLFSKIKNFISAPICR